MCRKISVKSGLISLAVSLLVILGSGDAFFGEKRGLTWGSTASTTGGFTYFVNAAKVLNEKIPEINVTVRSTGGGVHNTRLLEKGEIDFGAIDTSGAWEAIQGKGSFEGKPFPDLRLLYVSATNPFQFVVSEKSGVKDIYGLEGRTFCPGMLGGATERTGMEVFRILGVRPRIRHMSMADGLEAIKNEQVLGMVIAIVPNSAILDLTSVMKVRIISFSDEDLTKIVTNSAGMTKVAVAAGAYPGVGEFKTIANEWSDYVRKDFSADLAYKIVKALWEGRAGIKTLNSQFLADRFPEVTLGVKVGYLHPGAIKFYRELGLAVPKQLVPPEMGEK
jgi:hypothetical protein